VFIVVALVSLIGAYTAGSCRQTDTTVYVVSLVGAVLVYISFLLLLVWAASKISRTKTGIWCKELVVWAIDAMLKQKSAAKPADVTNDGGDNRNGRYYTKSFSLRLHMQIIIRSTMHKRSLNFLDVSFRS